MKKRKSKKSEAFLDDLCIAITESYLFRTRTSRISERQMQAEIRPLIAKYLEEHFKDAGYVKIDKMVHDNFYWEGQDSSFQSDCSIFFGGRRYADYIILRPYKIAIEYKKSGGVAALNTLIGQGIMASASGDYDYCILIFQDETKDKRILNSKDLDRESGFIDWLWDTFNIRLKIIK